MHHFITVGMIFYICRRFYPYFCLESLNVALTCEWSSSSIPTLQFFLASFYTAFRFF